MRLLQNVLNSLKKTKRPQYKFVTHLLGLMLMLPGHATFRNMSRYSPYHERTFSRWYARDFDWVSLNKPPSPKSSLLSMLRPWSWTPVLCPKVASTTSGLDRFWNGSHSRAEKGLEISTLAWLDITDNCAYCLSVEQTPLSAETADPETTRMDGSLDQLSRVLTTDDWRFRRDVVTDGAYSKQKFVAGVRALELHQIGSCAPMPICVLSTRDPNAQVQAAKVTDGKVNWRDVSRFERLATEDEPIVLYHQVLNHGQLKRDLQGAVVVHTQRHRYAVLFSTDVDLEPQRLYRYDKARFQIEFLCRDAKPFTGLSACQARSKAKLDFHFNASLSAVTFAKLEARHQHGNGDQASSMASLKRRAFNQHLID